MTIRRFAFPLLVAVSGILFAACGGDDTGEGSGSLPACPTAGTTLTYDTFGKQFFTDYCNSCHSASSGVKGAAPYETQAQIQAAIDDIYGQAADTNKAMPQGTNKPSDPLRLQLGEWLSCGAK